MNLEILSNNDLKQSTLCDDELSAELEIYHNAHENINDIIAYTSCSDSNYVSEDSTVCSEGLSESQCLKDDELKDNTFNELIRISDKELSGEYWLFDHPNIDREQPLDLSFSALNVNVFIENEDNLLKTLRNLLRLNEPLKPIVEKSQRIIPKIFARRNVSNTLDKADIVDPIHDVINSHTPEVISSLKSPSDHIHDAIDARTPEVILSPKSPSEFSPDHNPMSDFVVPRRTFSLNPKRRLSLIQPGQSIRRIIPQQSALHASNLNISTNTTQKLSRLPTATLPQSAAEAAVIDVLRPASKLIRPRMLPIPKKFVPPPSVDRLPTPLTSAAPRIAPSAKSIAPTNSDNPLSRTFDKDEFQLLKSVTNTAEDGLNNNSGQGSERRAPSKFQSGLRRPSQPRSRALPH